MLDTTTDRPVRAALYARVSTADKGQDTETQLLPLRRLVEARGWHPTEYVDEGVSGSQSRRPALDRMMADVRAGRVDVVVVHRFDRMGRSVAHLLAVLDDPRALGCTRSPPPRSMRSCPPRCASAPRPPDSAAPAYDDLGRLNEVSSDDGTGT